MTMQDKILHQKYGIEKGNIFPLKSVFRWTQMKEILSSQLYENLQRALSPNDFFFKGNNHLFEKNNPKHNKEIYNLFQSYIVFNPNKLPDNFIRLFDLDAQSPTIQSDVEEIFKKARLLDRHSARIVFVEDKIVIFRNEQTLTHKTSTGLTSGEKNRSEIKTTFNTFSNIYDAVRSQYYTIQSSQEKQDDYKLLQQDIIKLAQEIQILGFEVKDGEFKRKLDSIILEINGATNFRVLGANLQNLQNLTFTNKSIDSNLLQGAKNKLLKRFKELQSIVGIVKNQLNNLENILVEHQVCLDYLISQLQFTNIQFAIETYNNTYLRLEKKYGPISPFNTFHDWINKYKSDKVLFPKFLHHIQTLFTAYKKEHQNKLFGKVLQLSDFSELKDNLIYVEKTIIDS